MFTPPLRLPCRLRTPAPTRSAVTERAITGRIPATSRCTRAPVAIRRSYLDPDASCTLKSPSRPRSSVNGWPLCASCRTRRAAHTRSRWRGRGHPRPYPLRPTRRSAAHATPPSLATISTSSPQSRRSRAGRARKGQTRSFMIGLENDGPNPGAIEVDGSPVRRNSPSITSLNTPAESRTSRTTSLAWGMARVIWSRANKQRPSKYGSSRRRAAGNLPAGWYGGAPAGPTRLTWCRSTSRPSASRRRAHWKSPMMRPISRKLVSW